ncbi:MAG TPA: DUF5995 family protein [Blastocatellia bacterium]|jgi:hypothetical protein|nr:DUF5995 family protein [Blastocatellia bacterium]
MLAQNPAQRIDEVIARLTDIIDVSRQESNRLGYFAALYRKVTVSVKQGALNGRFEDGARIERLDVNFANRYLEAYELHRKGEAPSASWQASFEAAGHWRPLILQHLLLGINAHINLDLGIAAVETSSGGQLASLKHDFDLVNKLLADLVQPVQDEIGEVSPWIGFLEKIDPSADDAIINFSMDRARASAWDFAVRLNSLGGNERIAVVKLRDQEVAALGRLVHKPLGVLLNLGLLAIRSRESNDVARVIDALS